MLKNIFSRACATTVAFTITLITLLVTAGVTAQPAAAADPPITQRSATGVTADALPTVQINGVVWDQAIVNNTVYAGGDFTSARPAGSSAGTNETPRSRLLSYDITTGVMTSFAPTLNGVVKVLALSPNKSVLYVGGSFTSVNGVQHNRIAAFNTATGALINTFTPNLDAQVMAISATNDTVYVGGIFSMANGNARSRLAAFNAANGALLGWAPTADLDVNTLLVAPNGQRVIVGGNFANINGSTAQGLGAVDPTSGALQPYIANTVVKNYGSTAAQLSLKTDGETIYGTGYWFGGTGNFEGVWAADQTTGAIKWLADCHGDTYDSTPINGAIYSVSHHHHCDNIASFPEQNPRKHNRGNAFTADVKGTVRANNQGGYFNFAGYGAPSQINWFPDITAGTFTGQAQGGFTIESNSDYVVMGGEFPSVNGTNQQGLVRFGVPSKAPKKQGNVLGSADSAPTLKALAGNAVKVNFKTNWDRDDQFLTYQVRRADKGVTPVYTAVDVQSLWWNRKNLSFIDTSVSPQTSYTYQIRENDPDGNAAFSASVSVTTGTGVFTESDYAKQVQTDGAGNYWKLNDPAGSNPSTDWVAGSDLTVGTGVTLGAAGAIIGSDDTAATFSGTSAGLAATSQLAPPPAAFSAEAWIKTNSVSGGKILGFGSAATGASSSYDRHIYMDNGGRISFGVYPGAVKTVRGLTAYNDNQWHHVVASLSPAGMTLYVDGLKIGSDPSVTVGQAYNGYWRVGGDNLGGWPNVGTSQYFAGTIDDVAIYPTVLTVAQIRDHYTKSGRTVAIPPRPTDTYGQTVYDENPDLYWRLNDTTGPTAQDASVNLSNGTFAGGVTYGAASTVTDAPARAVTFNGSTGTIGSDTQFSNPTVYSEELWFKTATSAGGKLIGFGDTKSGLSNNYDRHLYMDTTGKLNFGTYNGAANVITSPTAYNDNKWHHAVVTQSSAGMRLYVDGAQAASGSVTDAQAYSGFWRVGGDRSWAASNYFAGSIDEVAVYSFALSQAQVRAHYVASPAAVNALPVAAYSNTCTDGNCAFDGSTSSDSDGTISTYAWDFGDGTTGLGANASHAFTTTGSYDVALTVTDNQNGTNTISKKIDVTVPAVNQPPVADFTFSCEERVCSFDGSTSADPDGTITTYAWVFGDGATADTVTANHTFGANDDYNVKLTVTDNRNGSASKTKVVHAFNNAVPTAAFAVSCTGLTCNVDATDSDDPDGTIDSYDWDFGDTTSGSGVTTSRTYTAGGTYAIKLTVTDNAGATDVVSHSVTVATPQNQKPTAAFSSSVNNLALSFDGSGTADTDGTITGYAWTFGDGSTGTGQTTSHSYAGSGWFSVTLTVTDNDGATDSITKQVKAGEPILAADGYSRTTTNSWGTADTGGAWTLSGSATRMSTDGSSGRIRMEAPATGTTALLNSVSSTNFNVVSDVSVDKMGTGTAGIYSQQILRRQSGGEYRVKLRMAANGALFLSASRIVAGAETTIREVAVTGVTYAPGDVLRFRAKVSGTGTTTLTGKVWKAGTAEPAASALSTTDTTAALQSAGTYGIQGYLAGSATNAPVVLTMDNLLITAN